MCINCKNHRVQCSFTMQESHILLGIIQLSIKSNHDVHNNSHVDILTIIYYFCI